VRGLGYEDPWNLCNGVGTVFSFLASLAPKQPGFIVRINPDIFTLWLYFTTDSENREV
jgi:hypothetical protein